MRAALEVEIAEIHRDRQGTPFEGVSKIRGLDPYGSARSTQPTFQLYPRLACNDPERMRELKAGLQAWRDAYQFALFAWRCGKRRTPFPVGTFLMHHLHTCKLVEDPVAA